MNIPIILLSLVVSLSYFIQYSQDVFGETISMYPLSLFIDEEPEILGSGGIRLHQQSGTNIWRSPAHLTGIKEASLTAAFIRDDTWRVKEGDYKGSSLRSYAFSLNALVPITEKPDQVIGFTMKSDWVNGRFQNEDGGVGLRYDEDYSQFNVSYGIQPLSWFALGGGIGKENREAEVLYNWEIILNPVQHLDIGYREYQRNFSLNIFAEDDQFRGLIPILHRDRIEEVFFDADLFPPLSLSISKDLSQRDSYKLTTAYSFSKFRFSGTVEELDVNNREFLSLNGEDAGENRGEIHFKEMTLGGSIHLSFSNEIHLAYRKISIDGEGGGHLKANTVTSFWEEIISGDRIYLYSLGLDAVQYMIGMESQRSKRLKLRGGLQYVSASPAASLHHWTPFPIIGIGKLDETITNLNVDKIHLVILTLGFSYSRDKWTLSYGFGQYIPIRIVKRTEQGETVHEDVAQGGNFGDIIDAIKEYPGGNLQTLSIRYDF